MVRRALEVTYRTARRVVVLVIGGTVVLVGVAMIALPGPAFLVIPAGLAILGLEFAWARRWLRRIRDESRKVYDRFANGDDADAAGDPPPQPPQAALLP